jgi:hypothetical protein
MFRLQVKLRYNDVRSVKGKNQVFNENGKWALSLSNLY